MPTIDRTTTQRSLSRVVRVDALFEALLGSLLVVVGRTPLYAALDLPGYAPRELVVGFGLALFPVGAFLWWMAAPRRLIRDFVVTLGVANILTGLAFAVLFVAWFAEASVVGLALIDSISTSLIALGIIELDLLRRGSRVRHHAASSS